MFVQGIEIRLNMDIPEIVVFQKDGFECFYVAVFDAVLVGCYVSPVHLCQPILAFLLYDRSGDTSADVMCKFTSIWLKQGGNIHGCFHCQGTQ